VDQEEKNCSHNDSIRGFWSSVGSIRKVSRLRDEMNGTTVIILIPTAVVILLLAWLYIFGDKRPAKKQLFTLLFAILFLFSVVVAIVYLNVPESKPYIDSSIIGSSIFGVCYTLLKKIEREVDS
jgi:drug/metabolite transporter (DMT)-like permease